MKTIDLHCDTILRLSENPSENLFNAKGHINYEKLVKGDVYCQCFALFTKMHELADDAYTPFERLSRLHDLFIKEIEESSGKLKRAYSANDILNNKDSISVMLTIEGLDALEGKRKNLDTLISWKPKIASFTWNWENELAYPQSEDKAIMQSGLKDFGFEVLERFNQEDIIIDASHLSDGGFWDVIKSGNKVVATHSDCRAVTNTGRNLTDDMIRALADKGGVVGLNFCSPFLTDDKSHESRVSDMVIHTKHLLNVGGEDILAMGSDFDGIGGKLEIDGPDKFPLLEAALRKAGLKEEVIEKMFYKNILRLL